MWNRDSTGVDHRPASWPSRACSAADAIWGLAVTSMLLLDKRGLLEPYAPKNLRRHQARASAIPPTRRPGSAWRRGSPPSASTPVEAQKLGLPKPASWFDLPDPRFKGKLTMPHPASSGTGYFHVSAWIQMFGEAKAWEFMDRLHDNIAVYEHSGTRPCRHAAAGEFPLGISYELAAASARQKGAPIEGLIMKEGGGWDMDAAAILRGTRKPEAARRLMDFAVEPQGQRALRLVREPGRHAGHRQPTFPDYPAGVARSMIKNDFAWASENRTRILEEWARRYDGKAAKKS